jgi:hypothetical protein
MPTIFFLASPACFIIYLSTYVWIWTCPSAAPASIPTSIPVPCFTILSHGSLLFLHHIQFRSGGLTCLLWRNAGFCRSLFPCLGWWQFSCGALRLLFLFYSTVLPFSSCVSCMTLFADNLCRCCVSISVYLLYKFHKMRSQMPHGRSRCSFLCDVCMVSIELLSVWTSCRHLVFGDFIRKWP